MELELPKHLVTIMCEDIRREEYGKISLMGVYGDKIYFASSSMRTRSLAFYSRFKNGRGTSSVAFGITGPTGELVKESPERVLTFPATPDSEFTNVSIGLVGLEFNQEGSHKFEIHIVPDRQQIAVYQFDVRVDPARFK